MTGGKTSERAGESPAEVLFYHLERQSLEDVLPSLLTRTLERGWRAVVQAGSQERLDALDQALWTYNEDSFLPHGQGRVGHAQEQPVFLTTGPETPNGAGVRFLVDGAIADTFDGFVRVVYLFDGGDPEALAIARSQWTAARQAGCAVTYWQQTEDGRWERKG
ncbi:MAG TPA: DNA polymerase III subunit chi [Hyphomicrobium sp.]|nr:DNA polymerase III subunit chi [Hyphomicrobium sp.]